MYFARNQMDSTVLWNVIKNLTTTFGLVDYELHPKRSLIFQNLNIDLYKPCDFFQ